MSAPRPRARPPDAHHRGHRPRRGHRRSLHPLHGHRRAHPQARGADRAHPRHRGQGEPRGLQDRGQLARRALHAGRHRQPDDRRPREGGQGLSKELIVGKGIQKMFIPLDAAPGLEGQAQHGPARREGLRGLRLLRGREGRLGRLLGLPVHQLPLPLLHQVRHLGQGRLGRPHHGPGRDHGHQLLQRVEEGHAQGHRPHRPHLQDQRLPRGAAVRRAASPPSPSASGTRQAGVAYLCEAGDRKLHVWERGAAASSSRSSCPTRPPPGPSPASWSR